MQDGDSAARFEVYLLTERRIAHNTLLAYKRDITQLSEFLDRRGLAFTQVTLAHLKEFLRYLHTKKFSARSVSRKISAMKALFSYASDRFDWDNPAQGLHFPKLEKRLPRFLAEHEIKTLFDVADTDRTAHGQRNRVMLYVLYVSGMRISELVNLNVSDIRFETGVVAVSGKGGRQRLVPIPAPICNLIKQYLVTYVARNNKKGAYKESGYLFPVVYGGKIKSISRQSFWLALRDLCQRAGINRSVSPHQLRHSLATHLLKKGADLRSLQLLLGHENLATVQIYTHVDTSHLRDVYDKKHPRSR